MTVKTALGSVDAYLCPMDDGSVGYSAFGKVSLYTPAAVDMVARADDWHAARRAVRSVRSMRAELGPLRIRLSVYDPCRDECIDEIDVYGWRAALVAARALRREHGGARSYPRGSRRLWVSAEDARWADARDRYYDLGGADWADAEYRDGR